MLKNTKIKLICHWTTGNDLCQTWNKLTDGNYTFTRDGASITIVGDEVSTDNVDYIIVVNSAWLNNQYWYPSFNELDKIIFMKMEPGYMDPFWRDVDHRLLKAKIIHGSDHDNVNINNLEWHLNKTRTELLTSDYSKDKTKKETISSIISGKAFTTGHKIRTAFALYAQFFLDWDAYGNYGASNYKWNCYLGSPQYKDDALIPYKYSFACENSFINGYVTEKLIDGILSETLVFYCGAPNVSEFIDPNAYIEIDLSNNWDQSVKIMKEAIVNNEWEKRLPAIKKAKYDILMEKSMFPRLWKLIYQ